MKRTFTYLLLLVLLVCGKQAYNLLISNESIRSNPTGALSDIADEVIAIPLQDSGTHSIKEAKYIRQEGDNLFLISNETLYRFNRKGEFICRITHPDDIRVAGYVVNPANQQLIVLGNTDDIFYYSFNGDLLTRKKLKCDLPENRHMLSISMHNNRIFTTEECVHGDTAGKTATIEKQIVEYDSSFHKLQSHTIRPVDLERSACPIGCLAPEIAVEPGSGNPGTYYGTLYILSKSGKAKPWRTLPERIHFLCYRSAWVAVSGYLLTITQRMSPEITPSVMIRRRKNTGR